MTFKYFLSYFVIYIDKIVENETGSYRMREKGMGADYKPAEVSPA